MEAISNEKLQQLLNDNSTAKYYIEYNFDFEQGANGFFNHTAHGIVGLARLGVSEQYILRFIDDYKKNLLQSETYKSATLPSSTSEDIKSLLGKHKCFYQLVEHYETLLKTTYSGDTRKMVKAEFNELSSGMICALLHGLIHIGYGLNAGNTRVVCEGLAFLHHSYLPIEVRQRPIGEKPLGKGSKEFLEVLEALKNDSELRQRIRVDMKNPKFDKWSTFKVSKRIVILASLERADELLKYVEDMKIPVGLLRESSEDHRELMRWLLDNLIVLYTTSEPRNDFYLLHGVTGGWSLLQIISKLEDLSSEQAHRYVKLFLFCLLAVYVAQDCPKLNHDILDMERPTVKDRSWNDIITEMLADPSADEHIIKLVHVCRDRDVGDDGKSVSRTTDFYKTAALTVIQHPFKFGDETPKEDGI